MNAHALAEWAIGRGQPVGLLVFAGRRVLDVDGQGTVFVVFETLGPVADGVTVDRTMTTKT